MAVIRPTVTLGPRQRQTLAQLLDPNALIHRHQGNTLLPHLQNRRRGENLRIMDFLQGLRQLVPGDAQRFGPGAEDLFGALADGRASRRRTGPRGRRSRGIAPARSGSGGTRSSRSDPLRLLVRQFQKARDEANRRNEARFQQVLGGLENRFGRNMARVNQLGEGRAQDIDLAFFNRMGQINQDLADRGLLNTSTAGAFRAGAQRDAEREKTRLAEALLEQRINTDAALSGDLLSFIERKNERGPDFARLAALAGQIGQSRALQALNRQPGAAAGGGGGPIGALALGFPAQQGRALNLGVLANPGRQAALDHVLAWKGVGRRRRQGILDRRAQRLDPRSAFNQRQMLGQMRNFLRMLGLGG